MNLGPFVDVDLKLRPIVYITVSQIRTLIESVHTIHTPCTVTISPSVVARHKQDIKN